MTETEVGLRGVQVLLTAFTSPAPSIVLGAFLLGPSTDTSILVGFSATETRIWGVTFLMFAASVLVITKPHCCKTKKNHLLGTSRRHKAPISVDRLTTRATTQRGTVKALSNTPDIDREYISRIEGGKHFYCKACSNPSGFYARSNCLPNILHSNACVLGATALSVQLRNMNRPGTSDNDDYAAIIPDVTDSLGLDTPPASHSSPTFGFTLHKVQMGTGHVLVKVFSGIPQQCLNSDKTEVLSKDAGGSTGSRSAETAQAGRPTESGHGATNKPFRAFTPPPSPNSVSNIVTSSMTELLNYKAKNKASSLEVISGSVGDDHQPMWSTICTIDGKVYGKGSSTKKREANEIAACEALERIYKENPGLAADSSPSYLSAFNSYLVAQDLTDRIEMICGQSGPAHIPEWTCRLIRDGKQLSVGVSSTKQKAMEEAAKRAVAVWNSI
ncbi:uncharacterized protein FOMMEDRAFT_159109 [Fomitiporia mediterranea MF3/22]|uniref:uncharacterized protein n=1 Tax=Fomitiporia mediterranea (strain MF3/22) TaxID=694068 RepID=UPI00044081AF|nr:uncharacterized protein FOMMEDRAFT_159109 [Fomitiporia mediterranea MF3/22]EJD00429.1 hypothetical protein FOMMEDRAFT_159109 [Fomitiporia mediterranea MF3/22]